jgi:hypothetical protein
VTFSGNFSWFGLIYAAADVYNGVSRNTIIVVLANQPLVHLLDNVDFTRRKHLV